MELGFMDMFGWLWLILLVIFIVTELATLGLTTIWFAGGAAVGLIVNAAGASWIVQLVLFLAVSLVLMALVRPLARSRFNNKRTATNVDSIIGREVIVTETISNLEAKGRVDVSGMGWSARNTSGNETIEKGCRVIVRAVEGNKLMVEQLRLQE